MLLVFVYAFSLDWSQGINIPYDAARARYEREKKKEKGNKEKKKGMNITVYLLVIFYDASVHLLHVFRLSSWCV